jgi:hypothetical protein
MEWGQVVVLILGNLALILPLWLWARAESNSDRRDMMNLIIAGQRETREQINAIQEEMKDFHNRLYSLEERSRKK